MATTSDTPPISAWHGIKWCVPGVVALLIGVAALFLARRDCNRWLYDDRYVSAELEVTTFHPNSSKRQGRRIDGVTHTGV